MKIIAILTLWALFAACPAGASQDVPAFAALEEACGYIREQVEAMDGQIRLILPRAAWLEERPVMDDRGEQGVFDMEDSIWNLIYLFPDMYRLAYGYTELGEDVRVTLWPEYRFSARCLDAIANGRTDALSNDEYAAMNKALMLAGIAREERDMEAVERRAALLLCEHVTFAEPEGQTDTEAEDPRSGLCALLHGKANCQGYADAFCLIANLCGLECRIVTGWTADGVSHVWNRLALPAPHDADVTLMDTGDTPDMRYLPIEQDILNQRRLMTLR